MILINSKNFIFILSILMVAFISNPYSFGHANHGQEIPPILSLIDQDLYLNDFAIQSYLDINPRYFWQLLIAGMHHFFGISIPASLMIIQVASALSFFCAIFCITQLLSREGSRKSNNNFQAFFMPAYVSLLAMLPLLSWGSKIFYLEAIPSTLGMGIAIWSFYFALKSQWFFAYTLCGVSIFFHFLVGLFAGLVIFPFFVLHFLRHISVNKSLICMFFWLAPAFYIYFNMLLLETESIYQYEFFEVFGLFRVPHHWVPSSASIFRWISDLFLLFSGLFCFLKLLQTNFSRDILFFLLTIIVVSLIGLTLNYLFVEVYRSEFIGSLQFQRIIPFGHLAVFFLISLYLVNVPRNSVSEKLQALSIFSFPLLTVIIVNYRTPIEPILALISILIIIALTFIFYSCFRRKNIIYEVIVFSCLLVVTSSLYFKSEFFEIIDQDLGTKIAKKYNFFENEGNRSTIAEWLQQNTDKDELLLTPPMKAMNKANFFGILQLQSKRAMYFSHKNVPYTRNGVYEWAHRLESLLNTEIKPFMSDSEILNAWKSNTTLNIENLAKLNNICYIIDLQSVGHNFSGKIIIKEEINNETYILWRLDGCNRLS